MFLIIHFRKVGEFFFIYFLKIVWSFSFSRQDDGDELGCGVKAQTPNKKK